MDIQTLKQEIEKTEREIKELERKKEEYKRKISDIDGKIISTKENLQRSMVELSKVIEEEKRKTR